MTLVMINHDPAQVDRFGGQKLLLSGGRIIEI